MDFRTDRQRVHGLGTSGEGVHHWWSQRISSIALVPLSILFVASLVPLIGSPRGKVIAAFGDPLTAIIAVLFIMVLFQHLKQGLQVVMEDYVHDKAALAVLSIATTLFCWLFGTVGVFAVAKMAFSG